MLLEKTMKNRCLSLVNKLLLKMRSRIKASKEQLQNGVRVCFVSLVLTNHRGTEGAEERSLRREVDVGFGFKGCWQWVARFEYKCRLRLVRFLIYLVVGVLVSTLFACYATSGAVSGTSYRTSWLGNTFGGGGKWVQIQMQAMYVAPDGTVYTSTEWDEAGREVGIYKDGDVIGRADDLHGWGKGGGIAVTANSKYLFVGMAQGNENGKLKGSDYPPEGTDWFCVRRYTLEGKPASFSGKFGDGSMVTINTSSQVTGLAVAGNELYVSDPAGNRILVFDTETMKEWRSWSVARPRQIAVGRQGDLWIIQAKEGSNPPKIAHYSKTGQPLPSQIAGIVEPSAIAVDNRGRLLVADNGSRQQVLIYDTTGTPKQVGTFGVEGGIYSGNRGEVGDGKLYGITGVGTDDAGNIYISNDGFNRSGADLRKFDPQGRLQWRLLGLIFLDNADADIDTDGVNVFTKDEHYVMDYSKPNGGEWTYKELTLDRFRYPDDPRLHHTSNSPTSAFIRRIGGKRFLYLTDMYATQLNVYRFDGKIAVPSAIFSTSQTDWPANQPRKQSWLWHDLNGDGSMQRDEYEILAPEEQEIWGWEIDRKGDIWQTANSGIIRHYRFQGLDKYGSPRYSKTAVETIPMPAPFTTLNRIKYFPDRDVMYLGGYTSDRPKKGSEWGVVGTEIVRYDNWSKARKLRWRISLPYEPADMRTIIKSMDVAGDRIFAATVKTAEVYVYDNRDGSLITKLAPGPEVAKETGWVDTPYGLRGFQRSNGEYLVFVEEVLKGKVIMYRLPATKSANRSTRLSA